MSQSFIISAVTFIIVMVIFHLLRDVIIRVMEIDVDSNKLQKYNIRWLISTAIGLVILYLIY